MTVLTPEERAELAGIILACTKGVDLRREAHDALGRLLAALDEAENQAAAAGTERDRLRAQVERVEALVRPWVKSRMVSNCGRAVLRALDGEG